MVIAYIVKVIRMGDKVRVILITDTACKLRHCHPVFAKNVSQVAFIRLAIHKFKQCYIRLYINLYIIGSVYYSIDSNIRRLIRF